MRSRNPRKRGSGASPGPTVIVRMKEMSSHECFFTPRFDFTQPGLRQPLHWGGRPRTLVHAAHRHVCVVRRTCHGGQFHRDSVDACRTLAQIRSIGHRLHSRRLRIRPLGCGHSQRARVRASSVRQPAGRSDGDSRGTRVFIAGRFIYRRRSTRTGALTGILLGAASHSRRPS